MINTGRTDRFEVYSDLIEVYSDLKGIVVPACSKIGKDLTGWSPVLDCNSSDASISAYCTNTVKSVIGMSNSKTIKAERTKALKAA